MSAVARIIDANANRAREALRVMEDAARFALNDAPISRELKSLRHDLREALDLLPPGWLEANRDTPGDVGTSIAAPSEARRENLADVAIAAGKRLGESLRAIEESAKVVNSALGSRIESLRYRVYEIERSLHERLGAGRARQWRLCLLITRSLCRRPWPHVLEAALGAGADCVQVREKQLADSELLDHVRRVIDLAHPRGSSVIVNDRADIALAAGADGVHLGQHDLSIRDVRRMAGRTLLVGASTHDLEEARRAVEAGADYCGVGAMFATSLKPDREPSGPRYLREFVASHPSMPHLAIGGIDPTSINQIIEAGGRGVAVSSAICGAEDPGGVTAALLAQLQVASSHMMR